MGSCPWCGEESGIQPDRSSSEARFMRAIQQFDQWMEAHVSECEPYLAEYHAGDAVTSDN